MKPIYRVLLPLIAMGAFPSPTAQGAGAFLFANSDFRGRITHPPGYTGGTDQHLVITVGIISTSANRDAMVVPVQNAIRTWNQLEGTIPNLFFDSEAGIPSNSLDFESVLLHELGHALGMAHPNQATESGLGSEFQDFTKTTRGANGMFDMNAGSDGVPGSQTDLRGDDESMVWFNIATNDPFTAPAVSDISTLSQDTNFLPPGDNFVANGNLDVAQVLGYQPTEVVLQQGTRSGEAQRQLTPGCVALVRLAMSGFDRTAGTADDYTYELQYVGFTSAATITVGFNNAETQFAVTDVNATVPRTNHYVVNSAQIYFNTTWNWFYNQVPNGSVPTPGGDTLWVR